MEEYFDVLNEKGEYIGKTETREKCHKEGLWHKAVVVFIINSKSQVLLQKRSANKKMWPNMWDITAGGHVLTGEFGFQAAIRECKEELGIELNKNDIAIHTLAWNGFNSENLSKRYITFTIGISIELKKITIAAPSFIITT